MENYWSPSNRFDNLTVCKAWIIVALVMLAIVYGLVVYHPIIQDAGDSSLKNTDLKLYRRIVERIHTGESYYTAAEDELRKRGYTTHSPFNWRLPSLAWLLGYLPDVNIGRILVVMLASINLLVWMTVFRQYQYSLVQVTLGSFTMAGPLIYSLLPDPFLGHEHWAGTLIALSLAAYGRGWRALSLISGLCALFLRELSLPFVCVMMVIAYLERRRWESIVWLLGIIVFVGALMFHWSIVTHSFTERNTALGGEWIVFGGWQFVLGTAQMYPWLLIAPPWVTAITLPLALLGLARWYGQLGSRVAATVGIYILAFSMIGLPYNKYWGSMYVHLMPLGFLFTNYALRDLWQPICRKVVK